MERLRYAIARSSLCCIGIVWAGKKRDIIPVRIFLSEKNVDPAGKIKKVFPLAERSGNSNIRSLLGKIKRSLKGKSAYANISLPAKSSLSEFQWAVSFAARKIPSGRVVTYKDLAGLIGTSSPRAVGGALARNPFPLIIPCHRIVSSDRKIGGFQCGKELKKKLLQMEGVIFDAGGKIPQQFFVKGVKRIANHTL